MANPQLSETLYGLFYDTFKRTGIPITIDQMEALKKVTDNITKAIQDEIKDGMKRVATIAIAEMKALEERLNGQKDITQVKLSEGSSDRSL